MRRKVDYVGCGPKRIEKFGASSLQALQNDRPVAVRVPRFGGAAYFCRRPGQAIELRCIYGIGSEQPQKSPAPRLWTGPPVVRCVEDRIADCDECALQLAPGGRVQHAGRWSNPNRMCFGEIYG